MFNTDSAPKLFNGAIHLEHLASSGCGLFMVLVFGWAFYQCYLHPLRHIPGPFWARFTRLWLFKQIYDEHSHTMFTELHEASGPIVRVAPNFFSFNSPEAFKQIYNFKGSFPKTAYYHAGADPGVPNLFTERNEQTHTADRRRIASLYTMSSMVHYEDAVDRMNTVCLRRLKDFAASHESVMIPQFMQFYAFDVIGEISIDRNFGMMEANSDQQGLVKMTHGGAFYHGHVGIFPEIHPLLFQIRRLFSLTNETENRNNVVLTQLDKHRELLKQNSEEASKSDAFITKLLRLEAMGKIGLNDHFNAIGGNIAAGSDTTAITLSAALYYTYKTPRILSALRHEISTLSASAQISNPVTFHEAQTKMPCLQALIAETLRFHSAAGYILERTVPPGGAELEGQYFPAGTTVGVQSWALHRNKTVYGEDAHEFRPERHLEENGGKGGKDLTQSFAFGGGTRTCIGKNISLLEMMKFLPQIVRGFDLEFVRRDGQRRKEGEAEVEWKLRTSWFVFQEFWCVVKIRGEEGE